MPGGNKNIKHEDGVSFQKGNKLAEKWNELEALRFGNDLISWMKDKDENIFFEDFIFLQDHTEKKYAGKIYVELISYLANKFSAFSKLLQEAKKIEEIKLKKFGAFDKLNSSITKFLLSAQYGYSEKQIIDNTSSDGTMSPIDTTALTLEEKTVLLNLARKQNE